ncbi:acyl carrier protein [Salsipaludibacter albus]|uniref:acyl carrier protein n=1 Tax=Salsipaludibacter albus TaxID=2849650 RepID=UPI001EE3E477|nr:acyl carrier protein [Salsipaludibacter albus]
MSDDIMATFTEILTEDFDIPADEVTRDASFEGLGLDSLDVVDLTLALEEKTGITLEDDELEDVVTVGDAVDLAASKQE